MNVKPYVISESEFHNRPFLAR